MKITDEQVLQLAGKYEKFENGIDMEDFTFSRAGLIQLCHELIALAQEVEPLVWHQNGQSMWWAKAFPMGYYSVTQSGNDVWYTQYRHNKFFIDINTNKMTLDEAKEAAQQDYAVRVKSGLKYGGGE